MKEKLVKNIPNFITLLRIIFSVLGASSFIGGEVGKAIIFYVLGGVSDGLDGVAARKLNAESEFGALLDAVSDKVYAASYLIPSLFLGKSVMVIPLLLELTIGAINYKAFRENINIKTQRIGKFKTVALFSSMIVGLLSTLSIELYPLLWIMLYYTTYLQCKTVSVYRSLLNKGINEKENKEYTEYTPKAILEQDKAPDVSPKKELKHSYKQSVRDLAFEGIYYLATQGHDLYNPDNNTYYARIKKR